jgi:hypothetical protein
MILPPRPWKGGAAFRFRGTGPARGKHREQMWLYAAVRRARGALSQILCPTLCGSRLSVQSVRRPGTGRCRRNRAILFANLRCDISHVRQDRCQWRRGSSALEVSQRRNQGSFGNWGDQMEFYKIPCRSKRRSSGSLRTGGGTQRTRKRNREATLARGPPGVLPPAGLERRKKAGIV